MTSLQSEQTSVIQKQSSGGIAKYTIYHLIFFFLEKNTKSIIYKKQKTELLILASG